MNQGSTEENYKKILCTCAHQVRTLSLKHHFLALEAFDLTFMKNLIDIANDHPHLLEGFYSIPLAFWVNFRNALFS